jgi:hypothetical protein
MAYLPQNTDHFIAFEVWLKAALFALGASIIGFVVYPTELGFEQGISSTVFVSGRLFWGSIFVAAFVIATGNAASLFKLTRKGMMFAALRGLTVGLATILLYTYALSWADATPTIITVVGVAAITGTMIECRGKPDTSNIHVIIGTLAALYGALSVYDTGTQFDIWAFGFSDASGLIYGLLPLICRGDETNGATTVAQYLTFGFVFSLVPVWLWGAVDATTLVQQFVAWPVIVSGCLCTGLAYVCIQHALAPTPTGNNLSTSWATILYGMEPVCAMLTSAVMMSQIIPTKATVFIIFYLILSFTAGAVITNSK